LCDEGAITSSSSVPSWATVTGVLKRRHLGGTFSQAVTSCRLAAPGGMTHSTSFVRLVALAQTSN